MADRRAKLGCCEKNDGNIEKNDGKMEKRKTVKRNNVRQERKMLQCYSLKHLFNLLDLKESVGEITLKHLCVL